MYIKQSYYVFIIYVLYYCYYYCLLEHIGHVGEMSVCGYRDRHLKARLHQYVVFLSKRLNPHCFSRLSCEMSTRREHSREGCLFSAMSFPEEIALTNQCIFYNVYISVLFSVQCKFLDLPFPLTLAVAGFSSLHVQQSLTFEDSSENRFSYQHCPL